MEHVVAVAGATGALGARICAALMRRGLRVRALTRDPEGRVPPGSEPVRADVTDPVSLRSALDGAACVVSTATCFPRVDAIASVDRDGNLALVDAAEQVGARRFVFISFKPVPLDFPLQRAKRAVEDRLAQSHLDSLSLLPGKFMDIWFSPLCGFDVEARRATLFGDGDAPVTWIAAADVAEIAALAAVGTGRGTIELGGPEALTQRQVVAEYERATGVEWQLETLPEAALREMHTDGESDVVRSLGALMLEAHLGAVTDPASFLATYPVRLTSVREFAAAAAYSPSG